MDREVFLKKLGRHIAKVRAQKGYSQERLYLESGISRGTIYYIEGGLKDPHAWTLMRIADTIGVSLKKLTDFD